MRIIKPLSLSAITFMLTACGGDGFLEGLLSSAGAGATGAVATISTFNANVLYPSGIEPGNAGDCEAPAGKRCWWVDAAAPDGGDGSFTNPYNSFETVVGWRGPNTYTRGLIEGGDHLYVTGVFDANKHIDGGIKSIQLYFGHPDQSGTKANPTVVKSYKGRTRAVFDGQFRTLGSFDTELAGLIHVATSNSTPFNAIRLQNIEVQNAVGIGISFVERVLYADVAGVIVHNTALRDGASSRGGIHFRMNENTPEFIVRNSLFYNNYRNEGGVGFFTGTSNNIGGINILSDTAVNNGAKITIRNNILFNEFYAIRHKRSGNIITEIENNIIHTARMGFYIRGYSDNIFRNNLIRDISDSAVYLDAENQEGDMTVNIYNNTVVDSTRFVNTGFEDDSQTNTPTDYKRFLHVNDNIFSSSVEVYPISISRNVNDDDYDFSEWNSAYNLFHISGTTILRNKGIDYSFSTAMQPARLNDTTSLQGDPTFVNPYNGANVTSIQGLIQAMADSDYALQNGSPAKGAGTGGINIGAL